MNDDNGHYIVSARKYRPSTFSSVVGQKNLTDTLKNAIERDRLAHAYLFCGPRGVGKTSCARIFAKTINCLNPTADGEACGECDSCRAIDQGNSFNIMELDAASNNSVDDIRALTEQVNIPPQVGRYRVFIIDEVHMLSAAAFNAFLKTLEEPPSYVIFILATTEKHKVIPTILSRCQIYDFKRITAEDMVEHLKLVAADQGVTAEPAALNVIAQKADGAMRDALSIFDQVSAASLGNITYDSAIANLNVLDYEYYFRLVDCFMAGDIPGCLLIYKEIRDKGFDSQFFVNGLAEHIRNLMVAVDPRTVGLLEVGQEIGQRYHEQARKVPVEFDYAAVRLLSDCDLNYRTATNKLLLVELTLIRLCQLLHPSGMPQAPTPPLQKITPAAPNTATAPVAAPKPQAQPQPHPQPQQAVQAAPKAAAAPRPVSAAPATPRPQMPKPRMAPRTTSFRINRTEDKAAPAEKAEPDAGAQHRSSAFTPEQLEEAWYKFIEENGDKHILISAMRSHVPQKGEGKQYVVTANHPAQMQAIEQHAGDLTQFLRNELSNDDLTLAVTLAEPDQSGAGKLLKPAEFLNKVVTENKVISHLLDAIDAELI